MRRTRHLDKRTLLGHGKHKGGVGLFLIMAVLLAGCMAGGQDVRVEKDAVQAPPSVYTRYLGFPVPSAGIAVEYNPPVLRWPVRDKRDIRYDVRLSMDSLFEGQSTLQVNSTPWAMFNPHQELAHGTWYWQYREVNGTWSDILKFQVTEEAHDLVTPTPERFLEGIPQGHPRVLAGKQEVPTLRVLLENPEAQMILREAEKAMTERILTESDGLPNRKEADEARNKKLRQDASQRLGDFVNRTVVPLCQAYLLSGDARYRERALAIVTEVARWDPEGISGSKLSDFSDARCMMGMALAFDTFYDDLSPKQRDILLKAIHARAAGFYASWINNQEARLLSGHVWQHILHYFFQTALALHGDHAPATAWLSYAYELFVARTPVLGGTDGGWVEGVSYFKMNMETVIEIPLFIQKYTGYDFIRAHPWYTNQANWMIYNIPPGSSSDGFGDNSEEVFTPGSKYIVFANELAKLTGSRRAAWYAQACAQYEQPALPAERVLRWVRLTRTNHLPMPLPEGDLQFPTGAVFGDIGLVSMHSNVTKRDDDLMVAMRSSPFGCYGHFLADHNAFNMLYGGKRTFFRTGYKVTMNDPHRTGWYQHTKSNNSVLVDGAGQPYSTEAYGWIREFVEGQNMAYALGDASNAYASQETGEDYKVRKFHRYLLLLKPDIVVLYDDLASEGDVTWSWLIHSMNELKVDAAENTFKSAFERAAGIGKLWSSHPVGWSVADTFDVPAVNWRLSKNASGELKTYDNTQWHLTAESKAKIPRMRFLTILQVSPEADIKNIREEAGEGQVEVSVGKWTITANLDAGGPAALHVREGEGITTFTCGENGKAVLTEMQNNQQRKAEAQKIRPWYLEQSRLHFATKKKE